MLEATDSPVASAMLSLPELAQATSNHESTNAIIKFNGFCIASLPARSRNRRSAPRYSAPCPTPLADIEQYTATIKCLRPPHQQMPAGAAIAQQRPTAFCPRWLCEWNYFACPQRPDESQAQAEPVRPTRKAAVRLSPV